MRLLIGQFPLCWQSPVTRRGFSSSFRWGGERQGRFAPRAWQDRWVRRPVRHHHLLAISCPLELGSARSMTGAAIHLQVLLFSHTFGRTIRGAVGDRPKQRSKKPIKCLTKLPRWYRSYAVCAWPAWCRPLLGRVSYPRLKSCARSKNSSAGRGSIISATAYRSDFWLAACLIDRSPRSQAAQLLSGRSMKQTWHWGWSAHCLMILTRCAIATRAKINAETVA